MSSRPSHENESTFICHSSYASTCHRHVSTNNKLPGGGAGSKTSKGMRMRYWYRFVITASVTVVVVTRLSHHPNQYHPSSSIHSSSIYCCHFGSRGNSLGNQRIPPSCPQHLLCGKPVPRTVVQWFALSSRVAQRHAERMKCTAHSTFQSVCSKSRAVAPRAERPTAMPWARITLRGSLCSAPR